MKSLFSKINCAETIISGNKILLPNNFILALIGMILSLIFVFVFCILILLMREDFVSEQLVSLEEKFYDATGKMGFLVDDIVLQGQNLLQKDDIVAKLNVKKGDNILKYDIWQAKKDIEELPWVEDVNIRRSFFPNIIYVSVKMKNVIAIWQIGDKFYPIDENGKKIDTDILPPDIPLLIVGENAPENFLVLLDMIKKSPEIMDRLKGAQYISQRRWNVILDDINDGITIKLPEENMQSTWENLVKLNTTEGILKRKLTIVDLRLPDKVVVKLAKDQEPYEIKVKKERNI